MTKAFLWQWQDAIKDPDQTKGLSATAHHVGLLLATYADTATGECFPSQAALAAASRRSTPVVKRAIKELRESGWIERVQRGNVGSSNRYRLTIPTKPQSLGTGRKAGKMRRPSELEG